MTLRTPLLFIFLLHNAHFIPLRIGHVEAVGLSEVFSVSKILQLESKIKHNTFVTTNTSTEENVNVLHDVEELFMEQRLDHFHQDERVFSQRYFYSSKYVVAQPQASSDVVTNVKKLKNPYSGDGAHEFIRTGRSNNSKRHIHDDKNDATFTNTSTNENTKTKKTKQTFVFLCVGGEGPSLTNHVLIDSVHCSGDMLELASKIKTESFLPKEEETDIEIHLFALEHRYYGESYPQFGDGGSSVSNENLQYLSSRQAIADIANFIDFANTKYGLTKKDVKWVTFGGSYPGMLAAWSRYKFPHLIYGAVSNSAPVQVKLDFQDYNDVVGYALKNPTVGGSDDCYDVVKRGHDEIVSILEKDTKEGRESVAASFNLCNGGESLTEQKNLNGFLGDGVLHIPAQENDPSCEGQFCNIEKICNFLTTNSTSSPMEKLAEISSSPLCTNIDWDSMISFISSDAAKEDGTRSWLWQTCTEMGFYQTCTVNSTCPYARGYHTYDQDLEICEKAFGVDPKLVPGNVEETLRYYGGWDMEGSRILSVNGDIDPWSSLSLNAGGKTNSTDLPTYWSMGASHHFWTHQVKDSDREGISATRKFIYDWVIDLLFDKKGGNNTIASRDKHTSILMEKV